MIGAALSAPRGSVCSSSSVLALLERRRALEHHLLLPRLDEQLYFKVFEPSMAMPKRAGTAR